MADILLTFNGLTDFLTDQDQSVEFIRGGSRGECSIYGKKGTFCIIRNGADAIAAVGYVCHIDGVSISSTLTSILTSFHESQIQNLKKELIGQFILLIKKGQNIYLFSDFMGSRNLFYSDDEICVSTSFSKIEALLQACYKDLDMNKIFEFLALRHIHYPTCIGRSTGNRRIKWLLPYEYLVVDTEKSSLRIESIVFEIDNRKNSDCNLLSDALLSVLRSIVGRTEFKDSRVAASLTGGRDSRLIAAVAAVQYPNIRYRTAVSMEKYNSIKDLEVAKKLSAVRGIPLDIFTFQAGRDEERFREISDGFAPSYNHSITPLIESASSYALGLGGMFGTELFRPIPEKSVSNYVKAGIERARKALKAEEGFWGYFEESLYDELRRCKEHYQLIDADERDFIRLFTLLDTARYGSFITSAFNRMGYQLEPYGTYPIFDLAFRVAPALWGDHRSLAGDALVQKAAMAKLDSRMARILTYSSFRPMLPYTTTTMPIYLMGFLAHVKHWLRERSANKKRGILRTDLPGGYYLSDGWANLFLDRAARKYGLDVKYSQ